MKHKQGSFKAVKEALLEVMAADKTVSKPSHNAFEVENPSTGQCFSFIIKGEHIFVHNTSRGKGNMLFAKAGPGFDPFPHGNNSQECFEIIYNKSLRAEDGFVFLGYIDSETFKPLI